MTFDATFCHEVPPQRVLKKCHDHLEAVPVVNLHRANGRALDPCHVFHLADMWVAVHDLRDSESCDATDLACLPYELVATVSRPSPPYKPPNRLPVE